MIDIDDFKKVNDQYGHQVGDDVLRKVALIGNNIIKQSSKNKLSLFGRLGGEEFTALLPGITNEEAVVIAEQLRESINQFNWQFVASSTAPSDVKSTSTTVSIGVASFNEAKHQYFDSLIQSADMALYKAKGSGKNKVCNS